MKITNRKVRSLGSQVDRMRHSWPTMKHELLADGSSIWKGEVAGYQRQYRVGLIWRVGSQWKPWVFLINPPLVPRGGGTYEEIPHLLYYDKDPALSGLCLFDPEGHEWCNKQLVADTTMPWACEWLQHYEFWHFDGIWRGKSVGPESIAEIRASTIHEPTGQLTDDVA